MRYGSSDSWFACPCTFVVGSLHPAVVPSGLSGCADGVLSLQVHCRDSCCLRRIASLRHADERNPGNSSCATACQRHHGLKLRSFSCCWWYKTATHVFGPGQIWFLSLFSPLCGLQLRSMLLVVQNRYSCVRAGTDVIFFPPLCGLVALVGVWGGGGPAW